MKKIISVLLVVCFVAGFAFAAAQAEKPADTVESKIAAGQKMTDAELLELAKQETGSFYAYGNTSRIAKAMDNFVKKYGAELGLTAETAVGTKMSDSDIFTTIQQEATGSSSNIASMVMIQDGAQLDVYRASTDMFVNYIPAAAAGKLDSSDALPLVHQYINKLIIWNNIGDNAPVVTNVWQLTEASFKNKIFFKSPANEQVNMNFLVMCTSDAWATKLAEAYKALYGKDVELGSYKNAGYKWVAEFLANCNFSINSDTTICTTLAKAESEGNLGLFVLSKTRDLDDTLKANLTVAAFTEQQVAPFSGFMYPMYVQVTGKCPRPYTTMLFINYLMTQEGFKPWGGAGTDILGAYSTLAEIGSADGDQAIDFWKECLVAEDAAYIRQNKTSVVDFVNAEIAKK